MNSVRIKICGITNLDDARLCAGAGADYLGFIFAPMSTRFITPEQAGAIIRSLPGDVIPVGVFVNPSAAAVAGAATASGIRIVQLSGDEPPGLCRLITLPVIKVFRPSAEEVPSPSPDAYDVFAAMVDGGGPGVYGGSGTPADLQFATTLARSRKLFLAGGLTPSNVVEMAGRVRPYAVDIGSGTEVRPGIKDPVLVRNFCGNIRSATIN